MCVSRNLTRGRIRSHVVAACLYITCRLENTSHLLLDFSDITQVIFFIYFPLFSLSEKNRKGRKRNFGASFTYLIFRNFISLNF